MRQHGARPLARNSRAKLVARHRAPGAGVPEARELVLAPDQLLGPLAIPVVTPEEPLPREPSRPLEAVKVVERPLGLAAEVVVHLEVAAEPVDAVQERLVDLACAAAVNRSRLQVLHSPGTAAGRSVIRLETPAQVMLALDCCWARLVGPAAVGLAGTPPSAASRAVQTSSETGTPASRPHSARAPRTACSSCRRRRRGRGCRSTSPSGCRDGTGPARCGRDWASSSHSVFRAISRR